MEDVSAVLVNENQRNYNLVRGKTSTSNSHRNVSGHAFTCA